MASGIIPQKLIEMAVKKRACKEAVEFLSVPRCFDELNSEWCDWAAENMLPAQTKYCKATVPAWTKYCKATVPAWAEYCKAKAQALEAALRKQYPEMFGEVMNGDQDHQKRKRPPKRARLPRTEG